MDNPILSYVATIVPPERMHLYVACHNLLSDYYPEGWPGVLNQITDLIESYTVNDIEYKLHEAIIENLVSMVRECNLDINPRFDLHHNLTTLHQVALGLFTFEHHTDMVSLETRYHAHEDDAHAQVAGILTEVVPGFDEHMFYEMISFISPTAIRVMGEVIETRLTAVAPVLAVQPQAEVVQQTIAEYAKVCPAILTLPFAHIGGSYDSYIDLYTDALVNQSDDTAAHVFVLAAVLAKLPVDDARKAIAMAIQHVYTADMRRGIRVSRLSQAIVYPEPKS